MKNRHAFALNLVALALLALAVGVLVWAFVTFPPGHPRVRAVVRAAVLVTVVSVVVAAWAHTRASRAGQRWGRALAVLVIGSAGALLVLLYVLPTDNTHRLGHNEGATLGDIRSLLAAQTYYQLANGGHFDGRLECLAEPTACLPDYPPGAPSFLEAPVASLGDKNGYRRVFHPGPPVADAAPSTSASSVDAWAYVAVPVEVGYTGQRGFCGDSRGVVCFTPDGTPPAVADAACDLNRCEELE